jgi:hypothetical protein
LRSVGVAFGLTFIPLVGTISIVIAALVTLRKGALEGFWVFLAATLPYLILLPFQPVPMGAWVVGLMVVSNLLTWGFAALLHRYHNWNLILEVATLIGLFVVITAHVVKPDLATWWGKQLNTHLPEMMAASAEAPPSATPPLKTLAPAKKAQSDFDEESDEPDVLTMIEHMKPYATGILSASLLLTALLQLFAARGWQTSLHDPKKLRLELRQIRLSPMAGLVFLVTLILSYFKIVLAQDMLPVLYLAFGLAGVSLVHYACAKLKDIAWLGLVIFYSVLLGTWMAYHLPLAFQLVALLALLDVWFDLRERLNKRFSH